MIPVLVWGAPGLPLSRQPTRGWISMKSRNIRFTTALVTFGLFVALTGLIAPSALGAAGNTFVFDSQPQDAEAGETITSAELNDGISFVQVRLVDGSGVTVTNSKALV